MKTKETTKTKMKAEKRNGGLVIYKGIFFAVLFILVIKQSFAQEGYNSQRNYIGAWEENSTWTKSVSWLSDKPGTNMGGSIGYVYVNGYVTASNNLSVAGSTVLTINDTLWIYGNLNVTGGGSLNVADTGLLIITGSLNTSGGTLSINEGRIVVMNDLTSSGGANVNNNATGSNGFYVYGNITRNGGAQFNGSNNTAAGNFLSETSLNSNDPGLYAFINGVLPVTLLWTEATYQYDNVLIRWATASEINNEVFYIERSYDAKNFEVIGQVAGSGNSNMEITYQYTDMTKDPSRDAYYRLKQEDYDGKYEYSLVFTMKGQQEEVKMDVYPNPTTDHVFVHINSNHMTILLTDMRGVVLFNRTYVDYNQATFEIDMSTYPQGTYLLHVTDEEFSFAEYVIKN